MQDLPAISSDKATPHLARDLGISLRGLDGGRLMARVNDSDAHKVAADQERVEMAAVHAEGDLDAELGQGLSQ